VFAAALAVCPPTGPFNMAFRMYAAALLGGAMLSGSVLAAPSPAQAAPAAIPSYSAADITSGKALQDMGKLAYDIAMARVNAAKSGCTKDKVKIRKEW
jgi:hypothetical protein